MHRILVLLISCLLLPIRRQTSHLRWCCSRVPSSRPWRQLVCSRDGMPSIPTSYQVGSAPNSGNVNAKHLGTRPEFTVFVHRSLSFVTPLSSSWCRL
jgi:hypothetical protein